MEDEMRNRLPIVGSLALVLALLLSMLPSTAFAQRVDIGEGKVTGGVVFTHDGYRAHAQVLVHYNDPDVWGFFKFRSADGTYMEVDVREVNEFDPAYETGGVVVGARASFEGVITAHSDSGLVGNWIEIRVDDRGAPGTGLNRIRWAGDGVADTGWIVPRGGNLVIHTPRHMN
jgi:hypothetical protein